MSGVPVCEIDADFLAVLECNGPCNALELHEGLQEREAFGWSWRSSDTLCYVRGMVDRGLVEKKFPGGYRITLDAARAHETPAAIHPPADYQIDTSTPGWNTRYVDAVAKEHGWTRAEAQGRIADGGAT